MCHENLFAFEALNSLGLENISPGCLKEDIHVLGATSMNQFFRKHQGMSDLILTYIVIRFETVPNVNTPSFRNGLFVIMQPRKNSCRASIDFPHQSYLMTSLLDFVLVNAKRISPKSSDTLDVPSQRLQYSPEILAHTHFDAVD